MGEPPYACSSLTPKQLAFSSGGTFGSIAQTLTHLVSSEGWYLWLAHDRPGPFRGVRKFPGVTALRERAATTGDGLITAASHVRDRDILVVKDRGWIERIHKSIILTQALHHGNDHRTHVCTILGDHRLSVPDMDVWAYGRSSGRSRLERMKA